MGKTPTPKPDPKTTTSPSEDVDQGAHNLRLWRVLGKSDPRHTKPITGRGFEGTALKPMWQNLKMTETFGPIGIGWGMDKPEFTIREANETTLVYCTVAVWYIDPETQAQAQAYGVGGDVVAGKRNNGKLFTDDEAYKKAYTDALGNAFKFIGVAADIHMGMFDDSKYVAEVRAEFEAKDDVLGQQVDALLEQIRSCEDLKVLVTDLLPVVKAKKAELEEANRKGEVGLMVSTYNARKAKLQAELPDQPLVNEPAAEDQEPVE